MVASIYLLSEILNYKELISGEVNMAHVISDDCTSCGSCVEVCPVDAISEGDGKYEIDADTCVDCGACVSECPVEAISAGD